MKKPYFFQRLHSRVFAVRCLTEEDWLGNSGIPTIAFFGGSSLFHPVVWFLEGLCQL